MCQDIMDEVCGEPLQPVSGWVSGFTRLRVKGEYYPGMVPHESARVEGVVYLDVSERAWTRLDHYEGEVYMRHPVEVELADGKILLAETYLVRPEFVSCLESTAWSFADFLHDRKQAFQNEYRNDGSLK